MEWVTGDTKPDIRAQIPLLDADGNETGGYADLAGAAVHFQMRRPDDKRYTVNAEATIDDAATGLVRYAWGPNDLSVPGEYSVQWQVTWPSMAIQTTRATTITVRRQ